MNEEINDNLNKFWISFKSWCLQKTIVQEYFKEEYLIYDNWDGGTYFININYDEEYRIYYGIPYPKEMEDNSSIRTEDMQDYIEIMYARWIKTEMHYDFTVETNNRFDKFHLQYKLISGKLISRGYKTTEKIEKILNYRMFERKITFSEQMIMSKDLLDKKVALDYIVDALQYYISIQNAANIDKKYSEAAIAVSKNNDTKVYSVVKNEISEVMKLSNEFFDIRHNEYLNKAREKREALNDIQFIEYLYNRVYALLYLLRLKVKKDILIT